MAAGDTVLKRGSSAAFTVSPENVATSSTLLAGVESGAITVGDVIDELVGGLWTAGTSPTGGVLEVWVYGSINDTPIYPDVIDGTASAETMTSANVKAAGLKLAKTVAIDTTSNRGYHVAPFSIAALFGGVMPKTYGLFLTHSSGVNSNSTSGNHYWHRTPVYANVAAA